jgi:hypothetical protein
MPDQAPAFGLYDLRPELARRLHRDLEAVCRPPSGWLPNVAVGAFQGAMIVS